MSADRAYPLGMASGAGPGNINWPDNVKAAALAVAGAVRVDLELLRRWHAAHAAHPSAISARELPAPPR